MLAAHSSRGGYGFNALYYDAPSLRAPQDFTRTCASAGAPSNPGGHHHPRAFARPLEATACSGAVAAAIFVDKAHAAPRGSDAGQTTTSRAAGWVRFFAAADETVVQEPRAEAVIIRKKDNPYIPQASRYKSTDWLDNLMSLPSSSLLRCIRGPIVCCGLVAVLVCVLHRCLEPIGRAHSLGLQAHTLLGSALGLLLVFRTNTAYSRFWEGRVIWERILDSGRDLSRYAVIFRRQIGSEKAARICCLVQAFPCCMIEHLRGRADKQLRKKLERLIGDSRAGVERDLPLSTNRPLFIVNRLATTITRVPNEEGSQAMWTNRERCMMLGIVETLSQSIGECERIVQTPVPLTYVRHTSRFLSIFMFTLPCALVGRLGAITVAVTMVAGWALFGILEIGLMIEDPFRRVLKVEVIADTLEHDIFETIRFLGADDLLQALGRRVVEPPAVHSWAEAALVVPALQPPSASPATGDTSKTSKPVENAIAVAPAAVEAAAKDFGMVDQVDSGGFILFDDFKKALQDVDPNRWPKERIKQVFDMADGDADGVISFKEWRGIVQTAEGLLRVSGMPSSKPLPADLNDDNGYVVKDEDDQDDQEEDQEEPEKQAEHEGTEQEREEEQREHHDTLPEPEVGLTGRGEAAGSSAVHNTYLSASLPTARSPHGGDT